MSAPIRITVPTIEEDDLAAVREVLESGFLVQGPRVEAFEAAVAAEAGTAHAVAVANGTAALHLALVALDVRPGDLVVTTAYSWPATANVVELCGATPVFVDIEPDTFNLDPDALDATLRRLFAVDAVGRRVRAVLPVHAFGQMADIERIGALCAAYDLPLVEDAACALGASWAGRPAGGAGTMGCFSFHPRKAVTTGEGGVVTTDDGALASRLRALRNHGQERGADGHVRFTMAGFNYRLTEVQGALGVTQMAKLDRIVEARRAGAARYDSLFAGGPVQPPAVPAPSHHVYQSYVVLLPDDVAPHRDGVLAALREAGIEATVGTWHMPLIDVYRTRYGFAPGDFPAADAVFRRAVTLPLHAAIAPSEQERVAEALLTAVSAPAVS